VAYLNWAYEVIGEELARRVFKVAVLPFIDAIIDPCEREEALERAWERWQRKSWKTFAEAICHGDERMLLTLAQIYVEARGAYA
jgi:hypothetical protein